jgi:tetratricopeptide (TPR) repeat protein
VAFAALAKAAGLRVAAVKTVDHALCVIILEDGRRVDVETTNPYGFDPGTKKEVFSESFGRSTGFAYVPPSQYADRSEIGEKELLALILSNRIGELESAGRFREALVLALDYAVLAPGPAGRSLLGERLSNAAIGLSNSGKRLEALALIQAAETALGPFPEAAQARTGAVRGAVADYQRRGDYQGGFAFIAFARDAYGEDDVFMEFERVYVNNHALALIKAGSYEEALAFLTLDSSLAAMGRERIGALRENAALAWLSAWMGSRSFADQLGLARRIRDSGWVGETRLSEALQAVCGREASRLAAADPARGWLDSAAAFGLGLEILPVDSDLERGRKTCLDNHESVILNKSAALFNAGKRSEARQILRDALVELPGSARLVKRLADMEKAGD